MARDYNHEHFMQWQAEDNILTLIELRDEDTINSIISSGKKFLVKEEVFIDYYTLEYGNCNLCMNYMPDEHECKKDIPLIEDCPYWDCILECKSYNNSTTK